MYGIVLPPNSNIIISGFKKVNISFNAFLLCFENSVPEAPRKGILSITTPELPSIEILIINDGSIDNTLEYYMGKNTPNRQEFIINNLVIEEDV